MKWAFDDRGRLLMSFAVVVGVGACLPLKSPSVPHVGLTNLLCCCIVRCAVM